MGREVVDKVEEVSVADEEGHHAVQSLGGEQEGETRLSQKIFNLLCRSFSYLASRIKFGAVHFVSS